MSNTGAPILAPLRPLSIHMKSYYRSEFSTKIVESLIYAATLRRFLHSLLTLNNESNVRLIFGISQPDRITAKPHYCRKGLLAIQTFCKLLIVRNSSI